MSAQVSSPRLFVLLVADAVADLFCVLRGIPGGGGSIIEAAGALVLVGGKFAAGLYAQLALEQCRRRAFEKRQDLKNK